MGVRSLLLPSRRGETSASPEIGLKQPESRWEVGAFYQYHGWITLGVTPTSEEYELTEIGRMGREVGAYIKSLDWPYVLGMQAVNGDYHVWTSGNSNHKPQPDDSPVTVFRQIGKLAPGSYGLLYVWDDEDDDFRNAFRVYVLARGEVQERMDPFLSPCIPVLEDPSN